MDDFYQIEEINLKLNLEKPIHIIQISDTHSIYYLNSDAKEEIDKAEHMEGEWLRVKKEFADYYHEKYDEKAHNISSPKCLEKCIKYAIEAKPDLVLLTGDIIDYYSEANLLALKEKLRLLKKHNIPYLFTLGNHEFPKENFKDLFKDGNPDCQKVVINDVAFVGLNNSKNFFSLSQLRFIKRITSEYENVILCFHIPILTKYNQEEMKNFDHYYVIDQKNCDFDSRQFIHYIIKSKKIKAIFAGHVHCKSISNFAIDKPQICSSSGLIGKINDIKIA